MESTFTNTMQVLDKRFNKKETIIETTVSSFNVTQTKKSEKGINCTQWFTEENFNKIFKFLD
jgi:hypothetical protein